MLRLQVQLLRGSVREMIMRDDPMEREVSRQEREMLSQDLAAVAERMIQIEQVPSLLPRFPYPRALTLAFRSLLCLLHCESSLPVAPPCPARVA